jgi:cell division control protein 24
MMQQYRTMHMPTSVAGPMPATANGHHPAMMNGPVMATDNIINQVADSNRSLYQICVNLRQRLGLVPGWNEEHGADFEHPNGQDELVDDPVIQLWRCLRRGFPLLTVFNALKPVEKLEVNLEKTSQAKRDKAAAYKFNQACTQVLGFKIDDCFTIQDLYGDDTTGFVKVTKLVDRVLDILEQRGALLRPLPPIEPGGNVENQKRVPRDHVIKELLDTERKYVQDLESLQEFQNLVQTKGVVPGDVVHAIFANLNALLDFQRRFLIRVETQNSLPAESQHWGSLFVQYQESFRVYEPYISNKEKGQIVAELEFENLKKVGHQITIDPATLCGFLLKPVQRLGKYPLILKVCFEAIELSSLSRNSKNVQTQR